MANQSDRDPLLQPRLLSTNSEPILAVDLEWKDIHCTFKPKKGNPKSILKGMSGYAKSGEFLAIMGTSGAGKTTLLNLISGATRSSATLSYTGDILANGQSIYEINYNKYVGYVTQEDVLLDMLTVRESIMFAARLKTKGPTSVKNQKVDQVIEELGLKKCEHTLIGNPVKKGVSGGEKKRVCVAIELITAPSILFLDEPTSGLDSFTSFEVIKLLNEQAAKGRAVISTIHQPSSDIFMTFDKLLLLCDGHVMFHGPAKQAVGYFERYNYNCPELSNPADYFMELLHIENLDQKSPEEEGRVNLLKDAFKDTQERMPNGCQTELEKGTMGYVSSYPVQLYYCTWRAIVITLRNPKLTVFKMIILLFVALLMDILFWDVGQSTGSTATNNRNGSIFFIITTLVYTNVNSTILNFPLMREVFLKESRAKMYGTTAFFLSKNVADFLIEVFASVVFGVCVYWAVGYNTESSEKPLLFLIIIVLAHMSGTSLGLMAGAWFTRVDVASSLGSIITIPFYYFSGYLRPVNDVPAAFRWLSYVSPFRFSFDAMMINEYKDTHKETVDHILKQYDLTGTVGESILYLLIVMLGFRLLAFIGLKYNSKV
jgi:ABC-type multidrug transport system ATPase subunit/ABC-type multidrug transport system permease subunit